MAGGTSESTHALISRFYELLIAGDYEAVLRDCYHPDIIVEIPTYLPHGGVHRGITALLAALPRGAGLVDFSTIKVESLFAEAEEAMAVIRLKIAASDDEVLLAEQMTIRDNRIAHFRLYPHDPGPMLARMCRLARAST